MILSFLLLLQSNVIYDDPGDAPPVPEVAQHAYGAYLNCLMEPLGPAMEGQVPATPSARTALVQTAFVGCHAQRLATVAEMEAKIPRTGAWANPVQRAAKIEEIVGKAEQRLSFMIVSSEEYRTAVDEIRKCMNAGGGDTCKPTRPMK